MPPASKKGTGKAAARDRRSSSRHSTPVSALTETAPSTPVNLTPTTSAPPALPKDTPYLKTSTALLIAPDLTLGALLEKAYAGHKLNDPPSARDLNLLHDRIRDTVLKHFQKRGETCERNLRQVVQKRKESEKDEREREATRVKDEESRKGKKRSREEAEGGDEVMPKVGAHVLARQDGVGVHQGAAPPPSPPVEPGTAVIDPMDVAHSPSDSDTSRADGPSTVPLYERAFGQDPTKFDDPTVYDIRETTPNMSYETKRDIFGVKQWPESDLADFIAGDPPDMDLSNAKPANQVNFTTFQTYVEPYIRPFTEEDVAFLKERGDRVTPYIIPQRGTRTYKELWAAEDGLTGTEPPRREELDPNVPRGGMDDMNDEVAETDEVSMGPVMNRLLSVLRPQPNNTSSASNREDTTDANGDTSMLNGDDSMLPDALPGPTAGLNGGLQEDHRPLTALPPDAPRPINLPAPDYDNFETRALQELRYIGFLDQSSNPNYSAHNDDEVAARLRTLQAELRIVSARNNARKARILELTEERMAMQEYSNIADDLDNQVNAAYLKRNRSLSSKPAKKGAAALARAGGTKGLAVGGRGVSEGVKALMQKRRDWIDMVGPVVGYGRANIPGYDGRHGARKPEEALETVFDEENMARLEKAEREVEIEGADGEGE